MPTTITGDTGVSQIQAGAASGALPVFQCRAWVNFDATRNSSGGTDSANTNRFIRGSGNVASVLKNGTGDYTITFTTAMPDANYCVTTASISRNDATNNVLSIHPTIAPTASAVAVKDEIGSTGASADMSIFCVAIFR